LAAAGICNARAADAGNREISVSERVWNAGAAANPYKTAMNRSKDHHINHENSQNQHQGV
jgi:hypothetical protein